MIHSFDSQSTRRSSFSDSDDPKYTPDLIIPIPDISNDYQLISKDYKHLISSLLDVRIQKRYGVGERYLLFENHPWFTRNGISFENLGDFPSPISPKCEEISAFLYLSYSHPSKGEVIEESPPGDSLIPKHLLEYFQSLS